jgi:hypothetical protein
MFAATVLMLLAGLALAAWNTWQHLGRSPAARSWAEAVQGELKVRSVLVVRPLIAAVLVLGALATMTSSSTSSSVSSTDGSSASAVTAVLGVLVLLALVAALAWMVLPLPVPRWAQPRWFRDRSQRRGRRQQARG